MATYPVKYINESMRGAPVLNGQPGTLIAVLDAFLLTGFGVTTAVSVSVSGGVATATLNAGQSFARDVVVLVEGATPAALNGEARVLSTSNTSITWATTAPDGAATGTITIKVAPVGGWEKKFSATNKAVYRSTDPQASGFCLRVDDTGTIVARVRGYESMSDVDTGIGPFPTDAQISGGGYWWKSVVTTAAAQRYDLFADSRFILLGLAPGSSYASTAVASPLRGFGDPLALRATGDSYSAVLSCQFNAALGADFSSGSFESVRASTSGMFFCRDLSGLGGSINTYSRTYVGTGGSADSGEDATLGSFPSLVDGQLKTSRMYLRVSSANVTPRANVPGVLYIPQSGVMATIRARDTLLGEGDMEGRVLVALNTTINNPYSVPTGVFLVDASGPWR